MIRIQKFFGYNELDFSFCLVNMYSRGKQLCLNPGSNRKELVQKLFKRVLNKSPVRAHHNKMVALLIEVKKFVTQHSSEFKQMQLVTLSNPLFCILHNPNSLNYFYTIMINSCGDC